MIKAAMFKLGGNNMAGDSFLTEDWWEKNRNVRGKQHHRIASKELLFDEDIWHEATKLAAKGGLNAELLLKALLTIK